MDVLAVHAALLASGNVLECEQSATVDESLDAERSFFAHSWDGEEKAGTTGGVDITTDSVLTISGTKTRETEATDIGRATKLEAVVQAG